MRGPASVKCREPGTRNPKPETPPMRTEASSVQTLHELVQSLNPNPDTRNPKPETLTMCTKASSVQTLHKLVQSLNPKSETRNPDAARAGSISQPETRNPKSETRIPRPQTPTMCTRASRIETLHELVLPRNPKP